MSPSSPGPRPGSVSVSRRTSRSLVRFGRRTSRDVGFDGVEAAAEGEVGAGERRGDDGERREVGVRDGERVGLDVSVDSGVAVVGGGERADGAGDVHATSAAHGDDRIRVGAFEDVDAVERRGEEFSRCRLREHARERVAESRFHRVHHGVVRADGRSRDDEGVRRVDGREFLGEGAHRPVAEPDRRRLVLEAKRGGSHSRRLERHG